MCSIRPIDRTLSGVANPRQGVAESDGIPQISSITDASTSDCLVSYPGHPLGESYPFSEM